jgi:hypothetical protein
MLNEEERYLGAKPVMLDTRLTSEVSPRTASLRFVGLNVQE